MVKKITVTQTRVVKPAVPAAVTHPPAVPAEPDAQFLATKKVAYKEADPEQVQAIKAEIMRELRADQDAAVVATAAPVPATTAPTSASATAPMESIVPDAQHRDAQSSEHQRAALAQAARRSWWHQDTLLSIILAIGVVVIVVLLLIGQQTAPGVSGGGVAGQVARADSAQSAFSQVQDALATGDYTALALLVDTQAVSQDIIQQFYPQPSIDVSVLPGDLQAQMQAFQSGPEVVQAGLMQGAQRDLRALLTGAQTPAGLSDGPVYEILQQLSGGEELRLAGIETIERFDSGHVDVRTQLQRVASGVTVPVVLTFAPGPDGWQLVGLPNLQTTLDDMARSMLTLQPVQDLFLSAEMGVEMTAEMLAEVESAAGKLAQVPLSSEVSSELSSESTVALLPLQALKVHQIAKTATATGGVPSVLLTLTLENIAASTIEAFQAEVLVTDAIGQTLRSYTIADGIGIQQGGQLEKTFRLNINLEQRMDRHFYQLPQGAIQVFVVPQRIELADGRVLTHQS